MKRIAFHPEAQDELTSAAAFYNAQVTGLGDELTDEVDRALQLVWATPGLGTPIGREHRKWPVRRFPYDLIYRADEEGLFVLAVAHQRRRPGYWRDRS